MGIRPNGLFLHLTSKAGRRYSRSFVLKDHPNETTENSVDIGYFAFVHHYERPCPQKELETEGHYLSTGYVVSRALKVLGLTLTKYDVFFNIQIYGLGYSLVDMRLRLFKVNARSWVLPTSIDNTKMTLRLAMSMRKIAHHPWRSRQPIGGLVYL